VAAAAAALFIALSAPAALSAADTSQAVRRLQRDITAALSAPHLQAGTWGVAVRSLSKRETVFDLNATKLLVPSSNMKIVTLAAAAERLGWDFTYETRLEAAGPIASGVLNGDLVVVGSGDPSIDDWDGIATRLFQEWSDQLKAAGVRTIAGRIVGDDNTFADEGVGSGWAWDDLDRSFATSVGALQFNENTAQITVTPAPQAGAAATITWAPPSAMLVVRGTVATGPRGTFVTLATQRLPGSQALDVRGSVPLGTAPIVRNVSVLNPTAYFVNHLRAALIANGIEVRGAAVDIDDAAAPPLRQSLTPLVSHRSPPLSELATTMMRLSQNLYAETLLKTLGNWVGLPTTQGGIAAVKNVMENWNIPADGLHQIDGSGLSHYNLVTPDTFVRILSHVDAEPRLRDTFRATLPVAGRAGTLENRMRGTPAQGNARAKTGSLTNARSLSGYVTSADGEPLAFSIIANNYGISAETIDKAEDDIVVRLARFTRK